MANGNDLELLSAYLDDALPAEERAALERRLQADAGLRRELARLRATVELIGTLPPLRAPRDLTLTPSIARRARRPTLLTSAAFSAMSAAAAVVLLVIGVALFSAAPAAAPLPEQVAFAPTALATQAALSDITNGSSSTGGAANAQPAEATALKSETVPGSDSLFRALPTGTPTLMASVAPMLYAAPVTEEAAAAGALALQAADSAYQEAQTEELSSVDDQALPSAAGAAPAAEAPLPAPTLLLPSATMLPTAAPLPSATATPTVTPQPPSATPSATPTVTPPPSVTPSPVPTAVPARSSAVSTNTVGLGLIAAALLLLVVALVTTILRRRA